MSRHVPVSLFETLERRQTAPASALSVPVPSESIIFNLYLALGAMLVQQTFATVGLAVEPALVGVYLAIGSVAGFLTTLGCGGFIMRYGALRMTQVGMLALGTGLAITTAGWLPLFAAGAFIGGLGQAVSTPSSSHLLGRLSPRHLAPLVFSLKQTGVPAGLMLAGVAGRRGRLAHGASRSGRPLPVVGRGVAALAGAFRRRPQSGPAPVAGRHPGKRRRRPARSGAADVCLAMFSFVGLQSLFTGFFVLYLVRGLGYDLERAGLVFAIAVGIAVPARIGWGWLASHLVRPATLLALLGVGMAGAAATAQLLAPSLLARFRTCRRRGSGERPAAG